MVYYDIMRGIQNIFSIRVEIVGLAIEKGISEAARQYNTTRKTVRKWVRRYKEERRRGLCDRSRAPKRIPHKTPKEIEEKVIELRKAHPAWGPERLKMHYNLSISTKAIGRIIHQAGLVRKRKKKWKKQRDLRELKKQLKPFQLVEVDVKDLCDIEKYWPQMRRYHLPRYQFTARDVRTGGEWHAYGESKDSTNAAIFAKYLLLQLKTYGMDMEKVTIQTDNGSEFIGSVLKKKGESAFKKVIKEFGVIHSQIPPRACTWQSDVEAFHKIVEDEFYDIEDYEEFSDFMAKSYSYHLYFNFKRPNRYRERKTPIEIFKECGSNISPSVFNLPPIILDNFIDDFIKDGYHVGLSDNLKERIT